MIITHGTDITFLDIGSEMPKPIKDMPCSPSEESIEWTKLQKTDNRYRKWDEEELIELGLPPDFPCCDCGKDKSSADDPVRENCLWTLGEFRGWDEEDYIESGAGLPPWFPRRCDCGKYTDKKNKFANAETIEIDPKAVEGN